MEARGSAAALALMDRFRALLQPHPDDLAASGDAEHVTAFILASRGEVRAALEHEQRALALFHRSDGSGEAQSLLWTAWMLLRLGDIAGAEEYTARLHTLRMDGHIFPTIEGSIDVLRCTIELCRDALPEAARVLEGVPPRQVYAEATLGWVYLAQGRREEALHHLETALSVMRTLGAETSPSIFFPVHERLAKILSGMEAAGDGPRHIQATVEQLRRAYPASRLVPHQPCLVPATVAQAVPTRVGATLADPMATSWTWQDPQGDCAHDHRDGIVIRAANGRDLRWMNLSTPRLLQAAPWGDYAVQVVCLPVSDQQPAIGGLLLWQDTEHYLVLERGRWGAADIAFRGALDGEECFLGRGRLPGESVWLRLEREDDQVRALCSTDGQEWFTAGAVEFPPREGEQLGLHAIGMIDRTIYHGAYPEGTAIRFESFEMWTDGRDDLMEESD
jgi:tetratricopeptide (TPR) repeat protein